MRTSGSVDRRARVVVVGAGFAGASFVRHLPQSCRRSGATLLIDRATSYPFIPLIHEVAVGRIHPESIQSPIPRLCKNRCGFLQAEVTGVDAASRTLETSAGTVGYEYLVFTPGSVATRPPEALGGHVGTFWTLGDALELREELAAFWDRALGEASGASFAGTEQPTVGIVGGGATGVELAAEVAALFDYLKKRTSRAPSRVPEPRVVLLEAAGRLMGWLDPYFHEVATGELTKLGVEVRLNAAVTAADDGGLLVGGEKLPAGVRVWTGGAEASPLAAHLPGTPGSDGRKPVDGYLSPPGCPEVYLLGDSGVYEDPRHGPLPPTAAVAVQQGPWAARDLGARLAGRKRKPFKYFDRGYIVSLGPESAVAEAAGKKLRGPAAQALYRSVFLYYAQSRRGRLLTGADWAMERTLGRLGFGKPG